MSESRLLLCTDMDRTVIPNGVQTEHQHVRQLFAEFCKQSQVLLVYVTGRDQVLAKQAIKQYCLPVPDYAITDVGTKIYRITEQQWHVSQEWEDEIDKDWQGKGHEQLKALFIDLPGLQLQEPSKQNTHKLSYYVAVDTNQERLLSQMAKRLEDYGVDASLVWSIDEAKDIGLLDVLPRNATKLHAIDFLRRQLDYSLNEVVFAGDSGNDLPVLVSPIPSVLVANATKEVKEAVSQLAEDNGYGQALYLATGKNTNMNGNYAAGVLEGVCHFIPAFRQQLKQIGFCYEQ
ncbi:HAD-IIB family hydrolase [Sulfuriflexus mobilis]|uniref:HAD-IIB family hydrolase n=1 Tax=Sulfuriflexus mobilis TaxID=1811807 RepID=UPI000F81E541|nr:HAD-IIB family hydrolase [Sulfuriflexus mobilis]